MRRNLLERHLFAENEDTIAVGHHFGRYDGRRTTAFATLLLRLFARLSTGFFLGGLKASRKTVGPSSLLQAEVHPLAVTVVVQDFVLARIRLVIDNFAGVVLLNFWEPHLEATADDTFAVHHAFIAQELSNWRTSLAVVRDLASWNVDAESNGLTPFASGTATSQSLEFNRRYDVLLAFRIHKLDAFIAAFNTRAQETIKITALNFNLLLVEDKLRRRGPRLFRGFLRQLALWLRWHLGLGG